MDTMNNKNESEMVVTMRQNKYEYIVNVDKKVYPDEKPPVKIQENEELGGRVTMSEPYFLVKVVTNDWMDLVTKKFNRMFDTFQEALDFANNLPLQPEPTCPDFILEEVGLGECDVRINIFVISDEYGKHLPKPVLVWRKVIDWLCEDVPEYRPKDLR